MNQWEKGICNEKAGLLFSHPCDRMQKNHCQRCERPICQDHTHQDPIGGQEVCTTCLKQSRQKQQDANRGRNNLSSYEDHDHFHNDHYHDPYFYGTYYGSHWGTGGYGSFTHSRSHHDPHDFTEADGESFRVQSDEGFESDMTES